MPVMELRDYRPGGKTGGDDLIPIVTVTTPGSVDRLIGARSRAERVAHLRRLADAGALVPGKRRLTRKARDPVTGERVAVYVFRGGVDSMPATPDEERRQRRSARIRRLNRG